MTNPKTFTVTHLRHGLDANGNVEGILEAKEETEPRRCHFINNIGQCTENAAFVSSDGFFCKPHFLQYSQMQIDIIAAQTAEYARRAEKSKATKLKNKQKRSKRKQ